MYPLVPFALVLYNGLCWDGLFLSLSTPKRRPASRWAGNGLQPASLYGLCVSWTKQETECRRSLLIYSTYQRRISASKQTPQVYFPSLLYNRRQLTFPDTSNGLNTTRGHDRSGGEEEGNFPSVKELLLNTGEAQHWQGTGSSDKHVTGGSKGNFETSPTSIGGSEYPL